MNGTLIKANGAQAKHFSSLLSPTRNFQPTGKRGEYFMAAADEVVALRDAEFLRENGAVVLAVVENQ